MGDKMSKTPEEIEKIDDEVAELFTDGLDLPFDLAIHLRETMKMVRQHRQAQHDQWKEKRLENGWTKEEVEIFLKLLDRIGNEYYRG